MPKRANADNVNGQNEPDWGEAWDIIEEVHASEQEQSTISGIIGQKWQRIEKMGVNRTGAQLASRIFKMEAPIQADVLRTMYALFAVKGITIPEDLVDKAERTASETGGGGGGRRASFLPDATETPAPPRASGPAPEPDHPDDDSDLAGDEPLIKAEELAAPQRINLKTSMVEALTPDADPADDKSWTDLRPAKPEELAAERERLQADFDEPLTPAPADVKPTRAKSPVQARKDRKKAEARLAAASGAAASSAVH